MTILTLQEAAELLRSTPITVMRQARKGAIPGFKVGRSWRFVKEYLEALSNVEGGKVVNLMDLPREEAVAMLEKTRHWPRAYRVNGAC